jgi:uncharacterized membrane-anchored protein YitT (DUF2179 family)
MSQETHRRIRNVILVLIGSLIAAIGFNTMFLENKIMAGGLVGLSIAAQKLFGFEPANFVYVANIPLLLANFFLLGKANFAKTLIGSWAFPTFIKLTAWMPNMTNNPLLAAIFGGIIVGIGLGIVFLGDSSTGGTGIITQIINKYTPLSTAGSMAVVDGTVTVIGLMAYSPDVVMYSLIGLGVVSYVVGAVQNGFNASKTILIISEQVETIKEHLMQQSVQRGVTVIPVVGGYTSKQKSMIMTVVSATEFPRLEKDVVQLDPAAFVVVMPAVQVLGRGFSLTKDFTLPNDDIVSPM